eukprot:gene677-366_t
MLVKVSAVVFVTGICYGVLWPIHVLAQEENITYELFDLAEDGELSEERRLAIVSSELEFLSKGVIGADRNEIYLPPISDNVKVDLRAGLSYTQMSILAQDGLTGDDGKTNVQMFITQGDLPRCTDSSGNLFSSVHAQLGNGNDDRAFTWDITKNIITNVKFFVGGQFTLCYKGDGEELYEAISPSLEVQGATNQENKMWCPFDRVFNCGVKLEGYNQPFENATTKWTIRLITHQTLCEEATQTEDEYSATTSYVPQSDEKDSFEIHEIGAVRELFEKDEPETFKICYCPGFQFDQSEKKVPCTSTEDFIQDVGYLIQTKIMVTELDANGQDVDVIVYPTLPFTLKLICGDITNLPSLACSGTVDMRYKIMYAHPDTHKPYYDEGNKCRTNEQADTFVSPLNCKGPSTCQHEPNKPYSANTPKWDDVRIQAAVVNGISIGVDYDVCYCDGNCNLNTNWFKFGSFSTTPMSAKILTTGDAEVEYPVVNTDYFIKVHGEGGSWAGRINPKSYHREMKVVQDTFGSVDAEACIDEAQSPILVGGHPCSSSLDCKDPESTSSGQKYGWADEVPEGQPQTYDIPGLKIKKSGWVAICYCDQHCNQPFNWVVADRILIGGPRGQQSWLVSLGLLYDIDIEGFGLKPTNRIGLIKGTSQSCAGLDKAESQDAFWLNPQTDQDAIQAVGIKNTITEFTSDPIQGVTVSMDRSHGLQTEDMVDITGVEIKILDVDSGAMLRDSEKEAMFNRNHQVIVLCDNADVVPPCHKFKIPIFFSDADWKTFTIPVIEISWLQTNKQLFRDAKGLIAAAFTVCWAESKDTVAFAGQAGTLTVNQPDQMDSCTMGFSTVKKDFIQPIIIHFKTSGDPNGRFKKASGSTRLKITFNDMTLIEPLLARKMTSFAAMDDDTRSRPTMMTEDSLAEGPNSLEDMTQPACGLIFLEMFSTGVDGFPVPKGCYFTLDRTADYDDPLKWIWEFFMVFNEGNGLRELTEYEIVMNAYAKATLAEEDKPNYGIQVTAMDDVVANPFNVFEQAICEPSVPINPSDAAPPARLLTGPTDSDQTEKHGDGFLVQSSLTANADTVDVSGTDTDWSTSELLMKSRCSFSNEDGKPGMPGIEFSCVPCFREEDCGNGRLGDPDTGEGRVVPNPDVQFCISPVHDFCVNGGLEAASLENPAFQFQMAARPDAPVQTNDQVTIVLFPMTSWNIRPMCSSKALEPGLGSTPAVVTCSTESVTRGLGEPINSASEYRLNAMRLKMPLLAPDITDADVDQDAGILQNAYTFKVGSLRLPAGGFTTTGFQVQIEKFNQAQTAPFVWEHWRKTLGGATGRMRSAPSFQTARILTTLGDGNSKPFKGMTENIVYVNFIPGFHFVAPDPEIDFKNYGIEFKLPQGYSCGMKPRTLSPAEQTAGIYEGPGPSGYVPYNLDYFLSKPRYPTGRGQLSYIKMLPRSDSDPTLVEKHASGVWTARDAVEANEDFGIEGQDASCRFDFEAHMNLVAGGSYWVAFTVNHPDAPLKQTDLLNEWAVTMYEHDPTFDETKYQSVRKPFVTTADEGDFSPNISVMGELTNQIITPNIWQAGSRNMLFVFFRTEQQAGTITDRAAQVWVDSPTEYNFEKFCTVKELDPSYYVSEPEYPTLPLPVCSLPQCECEFKNPNLLTSGFYRARIYTITRLTKETIYGFALSIINTPLYAETQHTTWRIHTYTKWNSAVDGSTSTIAWNPRDAFGNLAVKSWGIFKHQLTSDAFTVEVADLRPSGDGENTEVLVYLKVPEDCKANFRVTAPDGYRWWFTKEEFVFRKQAPGLSAGQYIEGATADLPLMSVPIPPSEPVNQLRLDVKSPLLAEYTYGFKAKVMVPKLSPTASANFFTVEFGFDTDVLETRIAGGVAPALPVRALINARVDYRTSIFSPNEGTETLFNNILTFEINIVTEIERAGGLVITGPLSYVFADICLPKPVDGYPELPYDTTCLYTLTTDGQLRPKIIITAGEQGIPSNMYKFMLDVENPKVPTKPGANPGVWEFHSFTVVSRTIEFNDVMASFDAFPVTSPMAVGELIQPSSNSPTCNYPDKVENINRPQLPNCGITDWQYDRVGRDDRPGLHSQLIFKFALAEKVLPGIGIQELKLKGPLGFVFPMECIAVVEPRQVFDEIQPNLWTSEIAILYMSEGFTPWPQTVEVFDCVGKQNVATIRIQEGLFNNAEFVFRIGFQSNPIADPEWNYWVIEYNNEATPPFPGINIWTFSDGKISTTDTSISLRGVTTRSVVTIQLRSTNDLNRLTYLGKMFIKAPSGFILNNKFCLNVQVSPREMPEMSDLLNTPSELTEMARWALWPNGRDTPNPSYNCQSEVNPSNIGTIKPSANNYFKGGELYVLTIQVDNPLTVNMADYWSFSTRADMDLSSVLDSSQVIGFPVNYLANSFILEIPPTMNGLSKLTITFRFSFNDRVEPVNIISIKAPMESYYTNLVLLNVALKRTLPVCLANIITWTLMFSVDTTNPPITPQPVLEENLFKLAQTTQDRSVYASRVIPSYDIIPQLRNVTVDLVDPRKEAIHSYSTIRFTFLPETDANRIMIVARVDPRISWTETYPRLDFDFSLAAIPEGYDSIVVRQTQYDIVLEKEVSGGSRVTFVISNVRNPAYPGATYWDITTFKDVQILENRQDEKLQHQGFDILAFANGHTSSNTPDPIRTRKLSGERPGHALDNPFFGYTNVKVTFNMQAQLDIARGERLSIQHPPGYEFVDKSFRAIRNLRESDHGIELENPSIYYIVFDKELIQTTECSFSLVVNLPSQREMNKNWHFSTEKTEYTPDGTAITLPTNTNDGKFDGFPLVASFVKFEVAPFQYSPGAQTELNVLMRLPAAEEADRQIVVELSAPSGFSFLQSCISPDKPSTKFSRCTGTNSDAELVVSGKALYGNEDIKVVLTVTNPPTTPANNLWHLSLTKDESQQHSAYSTFLGFPVDEMTVAFHGSNKLGFKSPAFFSFTPRDTIVDFSQIHVSAPDYGISCPPVPEEAPTLRTTEVMDIGYLPPGHENRQSDIMPLLRA